MELVDIGANLAHESFADDMDAVLTRARQAGVSRIVVTGSDLSSARGAQRLAQTHAGYLYSTAGLHPHHARDFSPALLERFAALAQTPECVAIGETGLDFFRDISPRDTQERAFIAHLRLAADMQLPLFLHQRDAHARFLSILREHRDALSAVVVHCFTDTARALDDYLALDCHIGITGWVCDERRGKDLYDSVKRIPDDRIMIETDAPYLMPRNIRPRPKTRRNEPANLPYVLAVLAQARGQSPEYLARTSCDNACRFFAISPASQTTD